MTYKVNRRTNFTNKFMIEIRAIAMTIGTFILHFVLISKKKLIIDRKKLK